MRFFEPQQRHRQRRQPHPQQPSSLSSSLLSSSSSSSLSLPLRQWNINVVGNIPTDNDVHDDDDDDDDRERRSKHVNVSITLGCVIILVFIVLILFYLVSYNKYDKYIIVDHHDHDSNNNFYRYSNVRWHTDIISSHQFLIQELQHVLAVASSRSFFSRYNTAHLPSSKSSHFYIPTIQRPQLIIGRFGTSESEVMEYAIRWNRTLSNTTVIEPIPSNFYTPGYYFTNNETTLQERSTTVHQWGWQRIRSYADMNVFAILDWGNTHRSSSSSMENNNPSHTLQMREIEMYAPKSGYIHANVVMYPPCTTIPKLFNDPRNTSAKVIVPWTLQLENKIILIVHPFIDTIRQNIPKLHSKSIWSNVQNDHVYGAPYSCFPNVTEFKLVRTPLPTKAKQKISWLDSLQGIQREIDQVGYFDIALLGCGGYGLPLVSYISKLSFAPSAIYVGGALQLFFGIHGTRWSVPQPSNHQQHPISNDQRPLSSSYYEMWSHIYNDAWIWPLMSDIVNSTIGMIENGAYIQPEQAINQAIVQRHKWFDQ